jgi:hypothetical protein
VRRIFVKVVPRSVGAKVIRERATPQVLDKSTTSVHSALLLLLFFLLNGYLTVMETT